MSGSGMPTQGSQLVPVGRGAQGHGLAFAGSPLRSGASILTTTIKVVTFDVNGFLGGGSPNKKPVLIKMRSRTGTLTLGLGDQSDAEVHAEGVWTDWIPCTDLFEGATQWYVTGSDTSVLDYRIMYV